MQFTVVHSSSNQTKFPTSTLDDPLLFEFENKHVYGMREVAQLFQKYYILNFPLKQSIQTRRKSSFLEPYIADSCDYIILDFNDVQDKEARDSIISRFKAFRHVAFKTKSSDDLFSFNFRLVMSIPMSTRSKIADTLRKLTKLIDPSLAKINTSLYRKAQITAAGSNGILSYNDSGFPFKIDAFKEAQCWKFTPNIRRTSLELFKELGFRVRDEFKESVILNNDQLGDFVFFDSSPFVITNVITGERVSVEREFKRRYKIEDFRTGIPVKQLLDWNNKNRLITNKSVELGNLDDNSLRKEISDVIKNQGCLVLRSPMGSGKTRVIRDLMNKSSSCLFITPRVSLADEFYARFKEDGLKCYNKHKLDEQTRLFVCQFDSLYKIDTKQHKFDTIIIDEFMTLCDHITSSVANNREFNISKLLALMNNAKSMMICDAFMERIALDLIPTKFKNIIWVANETKDPTTVSIHKEQNTFLESMINNRSAGLIVSCVSVSAGLSIKNFLEHADIKVGLINASTPLNARDQIFHDYKQNKLQAIVYSPCVSVGVNLMGLRGCHYHYDPGNVIPVIQSIQMIRRSRNSGSIECYVKRQSRNFVPSLEEEKFNILQGNDTVSGVVFNEDGDRAISNVGNFLATLKFHQKIWSIDSSKTFARLCSLNFRHVASINVRTDSNLKLTSVQNIKEFSKLQKLEIYGDKMPEIQQYVGTNDIDDFILFEKFYRVINKVEGYELAKEDLVRSAIFGLEPKLKVFEGCVDGIEAKDYKVLEFKLPSNWTERTRTFWHSYTILNRNFLEACKILHGS